MMPTINDAQAAAYKLANEHVVFNPNTAIAKKWLQLKREQFLIGVPIGPELHLGNTDGQPRAAQAFTSGGVLVWYGGNRVELE